MVDGTLPGERTQPLRTGDPQTLGEYQLVGRLGEGGMGTVYLARTAGGVLVAVKMVRADLAHDDEFRRRFFLETDQSDRNARAPNGVGDQLRIQALSRNQREWTARIEVTRKVSGKRGHAETLNAEAIALNSQVLRSDAPRAAKWIYGSGAPDETP